MFNKHLTEEEFKCPCCGKCKMDEEFMFRLMDARRIADTPFIITSGFRCYAHNKEVGGYKSSSHTLGFAADIAVNGDRTRAIIVSALIEAGFTRIGVGQGLVHVDSDPTKNSPRLWVYTNK